MRFKLLDRRGFKDNTSKTSLTSSSRSVGDDSKLDVLSITPVPSRHHDSPIQAGQSPTSPVQTGRPGRVRERRGGLNRTKGETSVRNSSLVFAEFTGAIPDRSTSTTRSRSSGKSEHESNHTEPAGNITPPLSSVTSLIFLSLQTPDDKSENGSVVVPQSSVIVQESLQRHFDFTLEPSARKSQPVDVDGTFFVNASMGGAMEMIEFHLERDEIRDAIDICVALLAMQRRNEDPQWAITLSELSVLHLYSGDYRRALKCSTKVLKHYQELSRHGLLVTSMMEVGMIHFGASKMDLALSSWRESLQKACKVFGYDHPQMALLLNNIGCLHFLSGQYIAALASMEESLDLQRQALGASTRQADLALLNISTTLGNIGVVEGVRKQYDAAVSLLEESLLVQQSVLDDDNRWVQLCSEKLQRMIVLKDETTELTTQERRRVMGKLGGSKRETLVVRLFGDNDGIPMRRTRSKSPRTAVDTMDALEYIALGSIVREKALDECVRGMIRSFFEQMTRNKQEIQFGKLSGSDRKRMSFPVDVDDDNVIDAELHLSHIYEQVTQHLEHNEISDALDIFESTLRSHKDKYGEVHHLVGTAYHNIGILQLFAERYGLSLVYFQEAVNVRIAALGTDHPHVSESLLKMGVVQLARGDLDNSHVTFSQVLRTYRKVFGENHPQVAKVLNNIGCIHYAFGCSVEALRVMEQALAIQKRLCDEIPGGVTELAVAHTLGNIGFVHAKRKEFAEATMVLQEALEIEGTFLDADHPTIAVTSENLASVIKASNCTTTAGPIVAKLIAPYMDIMRCGT